MLPITDSIVVYTCSNLSDREKMCGAGAQKLIIHKDDASKIHNNEVTSKEYVIGDDSVSVRMSNHFYIKVRSHSDYEKLSLLAKETNVILAGEVPYMDEWYDLVVANSLYDNSLDMANYFFETGLFEDVDPGFSFNYKSNCVTDTYFYKQWALPVMNACETWAITTGANSVKIAIIDSGIDVNHEEFASTNFVNSYDCTSDTTPAVLYEDHGTSVCGVIASDHSNEKIAGIAPNVSVMPISFDMHIHDGMSAEIASGFSWAVSHGADVISCSWGDYNGSYYRQMHSALLEDAIENALNNGRFGRGCVVVFVAGNMNCNSVDYPANAFPEILTVGAINSDQSRASFSSYGDHLDVVAPGVSIYTIAPDVGYTYLSGTSFSAPYVSGISSLILSIHPELTQKEVVDIIESTTQKVGTYTYSQTTGRSNGTWNYEMGYGLVDAYAAVLKAKDKYIQNKIYATGISREYFPEIYAGYSVTDTIPYGNVVVPTGSTVSYKATYGIHLMPGFRVEQGANFRAYIAPAASNSSSAPSTFRDNSDEDSAPAEMKTINAESSFSVFPNPATDRVTISSSEPIAQTMLYNLNGQLVLQTSETQIDVSSLSSGVYIVHAQTSNGQLLTAKFVHL